MCDGCIDMSIDAYGTKEFADSIHAEMEANYYAYLEQKRAEDEALQRLYGQEMAETAEQQIKRLADFIMAEVEGEPSQSQGAVDTAIRLLQGEG